MRCPETLRPGTGCPLAVSPPSGWPRRGRRPPRFASKRGADAQLSALLRLAAQRGRVTAAAAGPPPDGCPGRLQRQRTASHLPDLPRGPGTAFAAGFELVTVFPCSSFFGVTQSPVVATAPPESVLARGCGYKMAVRCQAWGKVFDLREETGLSSASDVVVGNVQDRFKTR